MIHLARKAATLGALAALLILVTAGCRLGPAQTHPGPEPKNTAEAERTLPTPKERPGSGETPWPPSTGELQDPGSDTPAQERPQMPQNGDNHGETAQRPQNGIATTGETGPNAAERRDRRAEKPAQAAAERHCNHGAPAPRGDANSRPG